MPSLLYIACVNIDLNKPDGVAKKILDHFETFQKDFQVDLVTYEKNRILLKEQDNFTYLEARKPKRFYLYQLIYKIVKEKGYDNIYIRYPLADPLLLFLLKKIRMINNNVKICIEIATYPYTKSHDGDLKSYLIRKVDSLYSKKLHKFVNRIITFSKDKSIFGIPTINTINGINFSRVKLTESLYDYQKLDLISVSMLYVCHGYDRIIEGLRIYYSVEQKVKVYFHIVGEGPEYNRYRDLINRYSLEKYVFLHGFLSGDNLDNLYGLSHIAVNSLAIHRIGLENESTLKAKEYAAKGLPIISSSFIDSFSSQDNFKYVFKVDGTDSPIDIYKLIIFYNNVYKQPNLHNEIRERSSQVCDMSVALKPVSSFYNS